MEFCPLISVSSTASLDGGFLFSDLDQLQLSTNSQSLALSVSSIRPYYELV